MTPRRVVVPMGFAVFLVAATLAGVAGGYATGSLLSSSSDSEVAAPTVATGDERPADQPTKSASSTMVQPPADQMRQHCLVLKDFGPMLDKATSLVGAEDPNYETSVRRAVEKILAPLKQLAPVKEIGTIVAEDKSDPRVPVLLAPYSTRSASQSFMNTYGGGVAIYFHSPAAPLTPPEPTSYGAILLLIEPTEAKFLIAHVIQHGSGACERLQNP